uniref:HTH CENPB-type domain-containing protein n=1 Tax=Heliothis virescens TaxID=7102 RepID=A0A2A4JD70_HELVI
MPRKRALWSEDDLVSAVRAVQRGTLTTYTAAERYKVPRRTIRNHLQTGSLKKTLGRKPILNTEEEAQLVQRIVRYAEIGLPVTSRILRRLVYKYCEQKNIKHNFNNMNKCAGKDWFKAFMKRNPEISIRKAQFMNPARAQKLNKFIVDDHFQKLRDIYDTRDLHDHPERIYNMDEKGCRLTIHHQQSVLAKKGAKRVHLQSSEHAESVTIAGCVNALGTAIPPMVIFKGKRLKPELHDNLPPGSLVEKSAKGYMTNELFKEFLKHLARYKSEGPCLLIFDGAACHLDLSIVDTSDSLGIHLYCLPSNTTHELQPLDKAVYRSFEHHWDAEVLLFLDQNRDKKLTKARFNTILRSVWSKCMTQDNILSGFRATGLYPFNPQAIPETAFAPSILTEVPAPDGEHDNVPALDHPHTRAPESGNTTPSILSEASTPDLDQENVPPIDSHQMKTPEPRDGSPSILTEIPIFDVPRGNITPVDFLLPATPEQVNEQSPAVPSTSTGQISRAPAMHRSFYRTIYGSSSSSEESDDLPLSQLKRNEFYDLLPTPDKSQKTPTVRQKAINYRGNSVTKDLFDKFSEEKRKMKEMKKKQKKKEGKERPRREKKRETPKKAKPSSGKKSTTVKGTKKNKKQVGWFCHACEEDRMDAMRRCSRCSKWYHEECVGLSVEDTDEFECPGGCE